MAIDKRLAAIIIKLMPQAADAIFPHGPKVAVPGVFAQVNEVALNPQPLPPAELGSQLVHALLISSQSNGSGKESMSTFMLDLDDWCGTGYPKWWPKPKPGPRWNDGEFFAGAGLAILGLAEQFAHNPDVQKGLEGMGNQFLEQAATFG